MLKKFKVEIEVCGPIHSTMEDLAGFLEALRANKEIAEENDLFALGEFEIYDEGKITVDEWNGDTLS